MRQFVKENWFKIAILIIVVSLSVFAFFFKVNEHNLNVINTMRACGDLSGKDANDCANLAKKSYIGTFERNKSEDVE